MMIKLEKVHKTFDTHKALNNLALNVKAGEIYGLLGANGAGKSTTLNLILGFIQPESGTINTIDTTRLGLKKTEIANNKFICK